MSLKNTIQYESLDGYGMWNGQDPLEKTTFRYSRSDLHLIAEYC